MAPPGVTYLVAFAAAAGSLWLTTDLELLWATALADLVATLVVFAFSVGTNNSSMYDAYWSVAPIVIASYWGLHPGSAGDPRRVILVTTLVAVWGVRLTFNWWRGWRGLEHEDWRYAQLRPKTGRLYWLVSLAGFHGFPTLLVFLGCLALLPALVTGTEPLGWMDGLGFAVTLAAIALEARADRELARFRREATTARARGEALERPLLSTGLWAWSRHPNYLGEIGFWAGLFVFGIAAEPSAWWTVVGPVGMVLLFTFISVPLVEARLRATRPEYSTYARRVPALLPRPPRR
jgi:steroid 5-alpha reductase family enzyme